MKCDLKETAVALIPKEELVFVKDDEGLKEHIVAHLSYELAERIMGILEREEEIIVRQSDLRVSLYMPTNSVEYRRQINWTPLVRCEDCKHNSLNRMSGNTFCDLGMGLYQPYDFCSKGERRDDDNDREQRPADHGGGEDNQRDEAEE